MDQVKATTCLHSKPKWCLLCRALKVQKSERGLMAFRWWCYRSTDVRKAISAQSTWLTNGRIMIFLRCWKKKIYCKHNSRKSKEIKHKNLQFVSSWFFRSFHLFFIYLFIIPSKNVQYCTYVPLTLRKRANKNQFKI
jgi:hypothetical protein